MRFCTPLVYALDRGGSNRSGVAAPAQFRRGVDAGDGGAIFKAPHYSCHRHGATVVDPEDKPMFPSSPLEFFTGRDWILRISLQVERHQPVGEQRRITQCDRSHVSRDSWMCRIVTDRINSLRHRFQESQTELPRSISEPSRGGLVRSRPDSPCERSTRQARGIGARQA
jgi:hypothetical protein